MESSSEKLYDVIRKIASNLPLLRDGVFDGDEVYFKFLGYPFSISKRAEGAKGGKFAFFAYPTANKDVEIEQLVTRMRFGAPEGEFVLYNSADMPPEMESQIEIIFNALFDKYSPLNKMLNDILESPTF